MTVVVERTDREIVLASTPAPHHRMLHNLPVGNLWVLQFWRAAGGFDSLYLSYDSAVRVWLTEIDQSAVYKIIALPLLDGLADGVWWVDGWVYDQNQINLTFKSSADAAGSGDPGTYTGQVLVADQPAQRIVTATALDADPPYLLARTVSDPGTGQFTLDWSGYSGQILITAIDDYGVPYAPGEARGVGERVHPSSYNGYTYEVTDTGVLGAEPAWPTTPGAVVTSGSVSLVAVPYYRPVTEGPIFV